jgi:hypothetical protein
MDDYTGFAQTEYEHVRDNFYPTFRWRAAAAPSARTRPGRPLDEARVALVASAGAYLTGQERFDLGDDGDPSYRTIPATADRLRFAHGGYDTRRAYQDPDVVFPLRTLHRLSAAGTIGSVAPRAFSFMGYIPDTEPLLTGSGPEVAAALLADAVDLVLLVPS